MTTVELRWPTGRTVARLAGPALGRGGEGSVYRLEGTGLPGRGPLVAKIFHGHPGVARIEKLQAMVSAPPMSETLCWPLAVVFDNRPRTAGAVGYAMAALDSAAYRSWAELSHPADRRRVAPGFSFRYALAASRNLGAALAALHAAGHVLGDVNESNLFVGTDATVRIVDTDSAQVASRDGRLWRCEVGKAEFTAPELAGRPFSDTDRTPASDVFAYAVAVYQLLVGGAHPTDGIAASVDTDPPSVTERLARRWTPALSPPPGCPLRPPPRVAGAALPGALVGALASALDPDPRRRPSVEDLVAAVDAVVSRLVDCPDSPLHSWDSRSGNCGWCAHAATGQPDPWAPVPAAAQAGVAQIPLPPVDFDAAAADRPARIRRAPRRTPPAGGHPGHPGRAVSPPGGGPGATAGRDRRSVLRYGDGTVGPRPALRRLAAHQPLLAARCVWGELPGFVKATPPPPAAADSPSAVVALRWATVATVVAGLYGGAAWGLRFARLPAGAARLAAGAWLGALAVSVAVLGLLTWRYLRHRGGSYLRRRFAWRDVASYAAAGATGALLVAAVVAAAVYGAVLAVGGLLEGSSSPGWRYDDS